MLYVCIIKCLKHIIVTMYWVPRILPYILFSIFRKKSVATPAKNEKIVQKINFPKSDENR